MNFNQKKGLLIDLDGTLIDNIKEMYGIFVQFMENHGKKTTIDEFESYNGAPLLNVLESLKNKYHFPTSIDKLNKQYHELLKSLPEISTLRESAIELLEISKSLDYKISLVTCSSHKRASQVLTGHQIDHFFDLIIGHEDIEKGKPSPEPFEKAMTTLNLNRNESFVIEDSFNGLQSGYNSGAKVCYLTSLNYRLNEMEERLLWKHVYSFNDVIEILKQRR